jgi:DNA-binding NtrC family response regulator
MQRTTTVFLLQVSSLLRRATQEMLEEQGYHVIGASTLEDAVLRIQETAVDLIIAEFSEPEVTAEGLARLFTRALGAPATLVIREKTLDLRDTTPHDNIKANVVLDKPVDPDELRHYVRDLVYQRAMLLDDEPPPGL